MGGSHTADTATSPVMVVPGKSIGPIAVGMTRRQISRVARPAGPNRFRVHALDVDVTWGHWGRARTLSAASGKLVVAGVPLADGPERLAQAIPRLQLALCNGTPGAPAEAYLPGSPGPGITNFGWYPAPQIPRLRINYVQMRRR